MATDTSHPKGRSGTARRRRTRRIDQLIAAAPPVGSADVPALLARMDAFRIATSRGRVFEDSTALIRADGEGRLSP